MFDMDRQIKYCTYSPFGTCGKVYVQVVIEITPPPRIPFDYMMQNIHGYKTSTFYAAVLYS